MSDTKETKETKTKLFTRDEVSANSDNRSAFIVIHNEVYDVTKFLGEHPGGEEVLLEQAGKDASEPFEDVGHSTDARNLMKQYKVGEIVESERKSVNQSKMNWNDEPSSGSSSSFGAWIIPIIIGIAATILYRLLFT